ncbi:hypothetical protein AURDEDRAFT_186058 [Auricularia subglabra TFB-10046 SS5]|nr:hypothetical protein AURDEDRAFT_186058 [Auricularia subglabra TFB-10046 SS5]
MAVGSSKRKAAPEGDQARHKRAKVAETASKTTFSSASDIHRALQSQSQDGLRDTLVALRNLFSLRHDETIAPQDQRLLLAKAWLDAQPGASDVFDVWEAAIRQHAAIQPLAMGLLAALLNLLATHFVYHAAGWTIIKTLLSATWLRRLNGGVTAAQNDHVLATLKLLNAISDFGSGRERPTLLKTFNWGQKSLPRLLSMRRKGKADPLPLARPDIRTLYILFILSFLAPGTPPAVKTAFLEEHRDAFWALFRGLHADPYSVARRVLEVCWEGVWLDSRVSRSLKVGCFTETTLGQIIKLYDAPADSEEAPADVAHHFLLAVCTRPGMGVCFRDRGWYPREKDADDDDEADEKDKKSKHGGKIHNKMLAGVLRTLKVNEDARQQELALRILAACPELVQGYWPAASLTLEARLASKWIINMAFIGSVVALPVPTSSFLLPSSTSYNPTAPPLPTVLESIAPTSGLKGVLTKGLQSSSALVRHTAALTLARCLDKLSRTLDAFSQVAEALEEGPDGQWTARRADLLRAVRARVPDLQVVVAFVLPNLAPPAADADESTRARSSLLSEAGLRLMWLYHLALPDVAAEARFEVGKLLAVFAADTAGGDQLLPIKRLHILRVLPLSDQFTWSAKLGSTGKTYLHALLSVYLAGSSTTQAAAGNLLGSLLGPSVLFSHDPAELALWLRALPRSHRRPDARWDGIALSDEGTDVLAFLDDCVQRCMRTPYRYLDDLAALAAYPPDAMPSPLLATLLEQLTAPRTFAPAESLAIFAFVRSLAVALVGKQPDLGCAGAIAARMRKALDKVDGRIRRPVQREVELLEDALAMPATPGVKPSAAGGNQKVRAFLDAVDLQPDGKSASPSDGRLSAHELVDWYRLVDVTLDTDEAQRLFAAVTRFSPDVAQQLALYIPPSSGLLWRLRTQFPNAFGRQLPFEWAFAHALPAHLVNQEARNLLVRLVGKDAQSVVRAAGFILHRLDKTPGQHANVYVTLLADLARHGNAVQLLALKQLVFKGPTPLRSLSREGIVGMSELVDALLNPADETDMSFAAEFCAHWVAQCAASIHADQLRGAPPWVAFMDTKQLITLLLGCLPSGYSPLLEAALSTLHTRPLDDPSSAELNAVLPALLHLANDTDSESLTALILRLIARDLPVGYDGLSRTSSLGDAEAAWTERRSPHRQLDTKLLSAIALGPRTATIAAAVVYRYPQLRRDILQRLGAETPSEELLPVVHALLDVVAAGANGLTVSDAELLFAWAKRLTSLVFKSSTPSDAKRIASATLVLMAELWADKRSALSARVTDHLAKQKGLLTDGSVLSLVQQLVVRWPADFASLASAVVNDALQALVRHYVEVKEDASFDAEPTLTFDILAKHAADVKVQFVDPFMTAAIQYRLATESTMALARTLVDRVALKPVNTNRYLQSIIQHNHIIAYATPTDSALPSTLRVAVIALLHSLFVKHPANACQPTHMGPLLRLYGGSCSRPDRELLSIFKLYETHRSASAGSFLVRWTASPGGAPSAGPSHALGSMDSTRVFKSVAALSRAKLLDLDSELEGHDALYDPVFVVMLFAQALLDAGAYSALEWVELFRTNAACVGVCMLSYRDLGLRQMAHSVLGSLWTAMKVATFQERDQTLYILDLLHDLVPPPPSTVSVDNAPYPPRLPLYTTLLLAHALRGLFHPTAPIYPIASRFLLQRPQVDTRDVPLLYGMLYSASMDDWRREQGWMLRFLAEGCAGGAEWRVLRRRHTWDLLASLFGASRDRAVRVGVLQVLVNLTCIKAATTSLVFRSQLLAWLELNVHDLQTGEDIALARILENIVVVLASDSQKAEYATSGQWRHAVRRCLSALLQQATSLGVVHVVSSVVLRLALVPLPPLDELPRVLNDAVAVLKTLHPTTSASPPPPLHSRLQLHRAIELFVAPEANARTYRETVENLWRTCLEGSAQSLPAAVASLTPHLLSLEGSDVGEWARRMIMASLA